MSQTEVLEILNKNKQGMTAEEIIEKIDMNGRCVRRALMVMFRYKEVLRERCKDSNHFKYVYKIA